MRRLGGQLYPRWLNSLVTPVSSGSAAASVTFCASAASSLVCSVSVSNCLREWSVDNSMNSVGDFTPDSFLAKAKAKAKAASVLALANSITLLLYSRRPTDYPICSPKATKISRCNKMT